MSDGSADPAEMMDPGEAIYAWEWQRNIIKLEILTLDEKFHWFYRSDAPGQRDSSQR